jgi:predicted alpha/beta-fold hydrolase
MRIKTLMLGISMGGVIACGMLLQGCGSSPSATAGGISPQMMADALHAVMESDRTVYTRQVVNRLTKEDKVIKASESW